MAIDHQAIIDKYLAAFEGLHGSPAYKMEYRDGLFYLQVRESGKALSWKPSQIQRFTARMLRRIEEKKRENLHADS